VSTSAFPHTGQAQYKAVSEVAGPELDHHAPLYTLRRSIVVSTWNGASLLRHLAKHQP